MITDKGYMRKTYLEILAEYQEQIKERFGVEVNLTDQSPLSMMFQVIAWKQAETEEIQETSYNNLSLVTANGVALDNLVGNYGDERGVGAKAKVKLKFTGTDGYVIPKGTLVQSSNELRYETIEDIEIKKETAIVMANAMEIGRKYNVRIGNINEIVNPVADLESVTNIEEAVGGLDVQKDDELREVSLLKRREPVTGDNKAQYKVWAKSVEGVGNVKVFPTTPKNGYVTLRITDNMGGVADTELIKNVTEYITALKPVNAGLVIETAKAKAININLTVIKSENYTLQEIKTDLEERINGYFGEIALNENYVSFAKISNLVLQVDGVIDHKDLLLNGAAKNIELTDVEIPELAKLEVGV